MRNLAFSSGGIIAGAVATSTATPIHRRPALSSTRQRAPARPPWHGALIVSASAIGVARCRREDLEEVKPFFYGINFTGQPESI
jgi:hypothetical protein